MPAVVDPRRQGIVAGLAFFATKTGCSLIAEGVERREEADALLNLGVECAQGFLFGRPERVPGGTAMPAIAERTYVQDGVGLARIRRVGRLRGNRGRRVLAAGCARPILKSWP